MKVYISLPITGHNINEQKCLANKIKHELEAQGHEAVNPFDVAPEEGHPYEYYMGRDIEALLKCDAIYMCCGHEDSRGCRLELSAARIYGKYVIEQQSLIFD